jgi:Domain of unknown function (DUF4349)
MKRILLFLLVIVLVGGCGGTHKASVRSYDTAYGEAPAPEESPMPVSESDTGYLAFDAERIAGGYADSVQVDSVLREAPQKSSGKRGPRSSQSPTYGQSVKAKAKGQVARQQQQSTGDNQAVKNKEEDFEVPLVVYTGYLKLRVKRLLEAVDEITRISTKQGGYIESLTQQVIVVRVPAGDFDAVMAIFGEIGEILDRTIKAHDVTQQFTDLGARLEVAKEARDRLLVLLQKVKDVEERLRILREIKRLSEQIEGFESTIATLQNLVDYFTITIELVPILENSTSTTHRSPFDWVSNLSAHRTTLVDGAGEFSIGLPKDFVIFEKDDVYRAQAADTTIIRGARVDNEPYGDNTFWSGAIRHEMEGRAEKPVADGDSGPLAYRLYRSDDIQPRYYLLAVYAHGEDLYVVEVFYPNVDAYELHHDDIIKSLTTFEVE